MEQDEGQGDTSFTSLRTGTTNSADVEAYYDDWADGYDETLDEWQYQAPDDASQLLSAHLDDGARILDVGCGTGLLGAALGRHGAYRIDGMDISQKSLDLAEQRGGYSRLIHHDLQNIPLPAGDDAYDAAASVGVLTYIQDAEALFRDLCRCVRPGGAIAFTQRSDLWEERMFPQIISRLETEGLWQNRHVSRPRAYLPGNEDFADEVRVIHTLCLVL